MGAVYNPRFAPGLRLSVDYLRLEKSDNIVEQWSAGWNTRYFDRYLVVNPTLSSAAGVFQRQGSCYVSSQIYHDMYVGYAFGSSTSSSLNFFEGLELQLGVKNFFNTRLQFDANNTVNLYSGFGDPRLASYYLTAKKES